MEDTLKVGILGAGSAAAGHAVAYSNIPDVEVSALWSRRRSTAEQLARQLNQPHIEIFENWQDVIERGRIDVLSITALAALRREAISAALERGIHVLIEKPPAITLEDARAIVDLGERATAVTAVCFNWRYVPGALVARASLREGQIGRILDVRAEWRWGGLRADPLRIEHKPWLGQRELGGGMMREGGIHELDRARFLAGQDVVRLVGRMTPWRGSPFPGADRPEMNGETGYMLLVELSEGALGTYRYTLTFGQPAWDLVFHGSEGSLIVTNTTAIRQRADDNQPVQLEIPEQDQVPADTQVGQYTWNRIVRDFVTAVRQGDVAHADTPMLPTLRDGLRAIETVVAAEKSEAERRWVDLAELR